MSQWMREYNEVSRDQIFKDIVCQANDCLYLNDHFSLTREALIYAFSIYFSITLLLSKMYLFEGF